MVLDVIIVGAGIGGLLAAASLRRSGHNITILEQRDQLYETGYGLFIPPNASRILKDLSLDLASLRPSRATGSDWFDVSGGPAVWQHSHEYPADDAFPLLNVHRRDYHQALQHLAFGADRPGNPPKLRVNSRVVSYDSSAGSVTLASGETIRGDLVVAADGLRSIASPGVPKYTGVSNLRFTIPSETLAQREDLKWLLPSWPEPEMRERLYFAANKTTFIIQYPIRDGLIQNFGLYQLANTFDADITKSNRAMVEEKLKLMGPAFAGLNDCIEQDGCYLWQIFDRDPLPTLCQDRLIIIGDAAHPMETNLGQGAAQAVEDGAVLGVLLDKSVTSENLASRLSVWNDLRRSRSGLIQLMCRVGPNVKDWAKNPSDREWAEKIWRENGVAGEFPEHKADIFRFANHFDALGEARARLATL